MSVLAQDVRYALRALRRAPGFTLVALATLTLGIGGTTAIFSVVDAVVLRELPYPEAHRLVVLARVDASGDRSSFAPASYLDLKRDSRSFTALTGFREDIVAATGTGDPERLRAVQTTSEFFDIFGVPAILGRTFSAAVDRPEGTRVAVISEGLWKRRFGGRPDAAGATMRLNGEPTTILGVMPEWFRHPISVDVWVMSPFAVPTSPVAIEGDLLAERDVQFFGVVGRLAPNVSREQADADVRALSARYAEQFPDSDANESVSVRPMRAYLVGETRQPMLVLLGAVAVVLLIACANVASLLLARGAGRRRELAVRAAIGASRGRLVRQLLTESLVLAGVGGILGVLMSAWLVEVLTSLAPENIPRLAEVRVDPRVALFAAGCTLLVGLTFGLAPAMSASAPSIGEDLKEGGRSVTGGRARLRNALVVAELAMALVLLIGAGLLLTSFQRLRAVDPGFRTTSLVAAHVPLPLARYDGAAQRRFYHELRDRLRSNPLTAQSALVFPLPLRNSQASSSYSVVGKPAPPADQPLAEIGAVSPGYFQTMGIALLQGRDLDDRDTADAPAVAVVNRTFAQREWPDRDPIGQYIVLGAPTEDKTSWLQVVGVVGDSRRATLRTAPRPSVYMSYDQFTLPLMAVVVRTDVGVAPVSAAVRGAVLGLDPDLPTDQPLTIEQIIERSTGDSRFRAFLIAAFAIVALVLATVGIYGLISYTVNERVPEIGIRLALGASPRQVGQLVVGHGLKLALVGVGLGAVAALASSRLLGTLLYGVSGTDPIVYAGLTLLLLLIAALASWLPARRAMKVDPMAALRAE